MSQISCMSFNILACDTHQSGFEMPAARYPYVLETIRDESPDLLGVQEACDLACAKPEKREVRCGDFNWCEKMLEGVTSLGYEGVAIRSQNGFVREKQGIGCGLIIFYKKDRFEKLDDGAEVFPHNDVRYFQWVKLLDKKYNREILFTNTHFSINPKIGDTKSALAGEGFRTTQSALLLKFWLANTDVNTALFATGDYNCASVSNAQTLLRSNKFKPSNMLAEIPDEKGTINFRKIAHTIDYCYVNPEAQAVKEYKVIKRAFATDSSLSRCGYSSDHRAIMTYCDYLDPISEEAKGKQ